jgi:hypothetical protein
MPVVVVCGLLLVAGLLATVRWRGRTVRTPWAEEDADANADAAVPGVGARSRRALWYVDLPLLAALATGLVVLGPGLRLVMRLQAVTAVDAAQGRITEADEVVGRISVGGTIGLVIFGGVFGALAIALVFGVLRRWLPPGPVAQPAAVAVLLIVTLATTVDPLRPGNPDFDLVGPDVLAVMAFLAVGVLAVAAFAAAAGRIAASLPLPDLRRPVTLLPYAPLPLLLLTGVGAFILLLVVALAVAALGRAGLRRMWADPRVLLVGRLLLVAVVLVRLPAVVGDLAEIL